MHRSPRLDSEGEDVAFADVPVRLVERILLVVRIHESPPFPAQTHSQRLFGECGARGSVEGTDGRWEGGVVLDEHGLLPDVREADPLEVPKEFP